MWTISPATRLDWFSGRSTPLMSGRLDLYWRRGTTGINASVGNGVTVPALADLLFRDGVGVAINPDLRPERVIWEIEGGFTQSVAVGGMVGSIKAGGFYGKIEDMILRPRTAGTSGDPGISRSGEWAGVGCGAPGRRPPHYRQRGIQPRYL